MKNEISNRQDHKEDVDEVVQQNLIRTFKRITKFQTSTEIEIRVCQGSKEFVNQMIPFHQACDIIQTTSTIRICTLDCSEVNDFKLTEDDIIIRLLEGDIHFIISHIHQGIVNVNMNELYKSIMRLHDHSGFP